MNEKFRVPTSVGPASGEEPTEVGTQNGEPTEAGTLSVEFAPLRRKAVSVLTKYKKLIANLRGDLVKHGEPERWKRYGDLLLANVGTAERRGDVVLVTDYFDEAVPVIEIEGERNRTISEIAEGYFRRYTKARNGIRVIDERLAAAETAAAKAQQALDRIDVAIAAGDEVYLVSLTAPVKKAAPIGRKKKAELAFKGARRFVSSDGVEILVGKKAADNDYLTFRIAKSMDTWLHAADYPGSHVVIRSAGRKELPNSTLREAAELAAFYSDAREVPKAAVNYTLKKFVNKPKRSAPGLVSLSAFKTILVEPQVSVTKAE